MLIFFRLYQADGLASPHVGELWNEWSYGTFAHVAGHTHAEHPKVDILLWDDGSLVSGRALRGYEGEVSRWWGQSLPSVVPDLELITFSFSADIHLCNDDLPHAFVLGYSDVMGGKVARWIQDALKKWDRHDLPGFTRFATFCPVNDQCPSRSLPDIWFWHVVEHLLLHSITSNLCFRYWETDVWYPTKCFGCAL